MEFIIEALSDWFDMDEDNWKTTTIAIFVLLALCGLTALYLENCA